MNKEEARERAEVMLAYANGKEIEYREIDKNDDDWTTCPDPNFYPDIEYRVKQEPREFWLILHEDGQLWRVCDEKPMDNLRKGETLIHTIEKSRYKA